jgi:F-type H+-transporting ATPase subunit b
VEALGINLGFLIAQIINFFIIFGLLGALLWRPIVNVLENRRETIEKGLEDARVAAEARKNAEAEAEKIRADARTEAQKIISDARSRADDVAKEVEAAANAEAENIRAEARERAEDERAQMLADMRGQVVSLAMAAANKLIGEGMDEKRQKDIVADFFSKAPEGVKGMGNNIVVISALPLTDAELDRILEETGAENVENRVNPEILGGLILRSGDQVIDASVRNRLGALASTLN